MDENLDFVKVAKIKVIGVGGGGGTRRSAWSHCTEPDGVVVAVHQAQIHGLDGIGGQPTAAGNGAEAGVVHPVALRLKHERRIAIQRVRNGHPRAAVLPRQALEVIVGRRAQRPKQDRQGHLQRFARRALAYQLA